MDEGLKQVASGLADELLSAGTEGVMRLLTRLGVFDEDSPVQDGDWRPPLEPPDTIGAWTRRVEDGRLSYVRTPGTDVARWSNLEVLPPRGERRRVVLLGESVARGFFYDPHLTPAGVLKDMLTNLDIPGGVEVLDLACHDIRAEELLDLARASVSLAPDVVVILAGNNWGWWIPEAIRRGRSFRRLRAHALRTGKITALQTLIAGEIAGHSEWICRQLGQLSERTSIPVVFLLPDGNLTAWQPSSRADCPWLAADGNERWSSAAEAARAALAAGDLAEAQRHATAMFDLDQGTAGWSSFLLGECARRQGSLSTARAHFERARDVHIHTQFGSAPTPFRVVKEAIRRVGRDRGVVLVDLPEVFDRYLADGLPGERLFLDYCHLSAEGILVAMAEAARQVGPLLGAREQVDAATLRGRAAVVDADLEAEVRLGAAIHNAHWGQPAEIVRAYAAAAADSPRVADLIRDILELTSCSAPSWTTSAAMRLFANARTMYLKWVVTSHTAAMKLFDRILVDALVSALSRRDEGVAGWVTDLRLAARAGKPFIELLDLEYADAWDDPNRAWRVMPRGSGYLKAFQRTTRFPVVADARAPLVLDLTYRIPPHGDSADCQVCLNGQLIARIPSTQAWSRAVVTLPVEALVRGINDLEIAWPRVRCDDLGAILSRAAEREENGVDSIDSHFPYFGEIQSARVSTLS
jgi:hypothetical protein